MIAYTIAHATNENLFWHPRDPDNRFMYWETKPQPYLYDTEAAAEEALDNLKNSTSLLGCVKEIQIGSI